MGAEGWTVCTSLFTMILFVVKLQFDGSWALLERACYRRVCGFFFEFEGEADLDHVDFRLREHLDDDTKFLRTIHGHFEVHGPHVFKRVLEFHRRVDQGCDGGRVQESLGVFLISFVFTRCFEQSVKIAPDLAQMRHDGVPLFGKER